ncbi:YggT family protein [Legionella fallonii]|uniref:YggT family protein n=1 Tax=Legionella fallonii LLAP-10 TaxID=1212491 RepID=A0A098G533_9GAMM|nr:YggT family protein [Legionella fallonii]CEG57593.1 conserved membrane protein of unknown function [Legionella fallonii LLAP-10]
MSGFTAVGFFLVSVLFSLLIFSLWIRISLRYLRISPLTPFGQLIHTVTDPLVKPVLLVSKQKYKAGQKYDWIAFATLVFIEIIKIICLSLLAFHAIMPIPFLLIYLLADLIIQPCNILFFAILIRVIMSYVNPHWQHPISDYLRVLTEPLLILGRRIIPDISGFDFSPIIIMIILKVITLFISASLPWKIL